MAPPQIFSEIFGVLRVRAFVRNLGSSIARVDVDNIALLGELDAVFIRDTCRSARTTPRLLALP